jgi:hypothetical protein
MRCRRQRTKDVPPNVQTPKENTMFDQNLLFSDGQALTADAYSTYAVAVNKTPAAGVWIEVAVTELTTTSELDVIVLEKAADSGWDYTSTAQKLAQKKITATGRYFILVQSKSAYLKLYFDGTGWGTATVTAGIVSGPQRDATA